MTELGYIVVFGIGMGLIALSGSLTLLFGPEVLRRILLPLVAFAAGSLIGGALFHMIPGAVQHMGNDVSVYLWIAAGFLLFLALEQFLHWHHSHQTEVERPEPLTYLILIADALHNFIGGLFVAASFLADVRLGVSAWLAAAAHEVPQEFGDFAVLVHGGWSKSGALFYNFLSGQTFLLGGLLAYGVAKNVDINFLIPFAAGNFLYIGAADLIPEIKRESRSLQTNVIHFASFAAGLAILVAIRLWFADGG